jgi:hypothetical protein
MGGTSVLNDRHTEFFGPDLGRGPFSSQRIETSALQIATALAQLRAPVSRADDDLRAHVDFIRELADRLAPDWAATVTLAVGTVQNFEVRTEITAPIGTYSLLDLWLADNAGGGLTTTAPDAVSFAAGTVLQTVVDRKRWLVLTSPSGHIDVTVQSFITRTWYWAATRLGRVYYSSRVFFP